ncbi:MAG TPA: hypothetical protein PLS69_07270, partial [Terricaulis sp.]|nr:hypothetical protein [Terricaulis sp.]
LALISRRQHAQGAIMARRTTHRSSTGTKLYAVRGKDGTFKDIQTFKRAHAADLRSKSKDEAAAEVKAGKKAKKSAVKKAAVKKAKAKKAVAKKTPGKKAAVKKPVAKKARAKKAAKKR